MHLCVVINMEAVTNESGFTAIGGDIFLVIHMILSHGGDWCNCMRCTTIDAQPAHYTVHEVGTSYVVEVSIRFCAAESGEGLTNTANMFFFWFPSPFST